MNFIANHCPTIKLLDQTRESDENVFQKLLLKNKGGVPTLIHLLKENIMKKIISIMCLVAMSVGLSACNTIKGVGKDVERGGEKVQDAATDAQR